MIKDIYSALSTFKGRSLFGNLRFGFIMEKEIWMNIEGYEDIYQVSNFGRVKSKKYKKDRILKPKMCKSGYLQVDLYVNGVSTHKYVHRLVLSTFNPKSDAQKNQINHINEIKTDNRLKNLEWITQSDNLKYGTRTERVSKALRKSKCCRPVLQLTKDGFIVKRWYSISEAKRSGFSHVKISECCNGKRMYYRNYVWKFEDA